MVEELTRFGVLGEVEGDMDSVLGMPLGLMRRLLNEAEVEF